MKPVLIYFLKDPTNPKKGYVGQTACWKTRFGDHIKEARSGRKNYYCCNWIRSLLKKGLKPEFEHVAQVPESDWKRHEIDYIAAFRSMGYSLTNTTPGGEGCGSGENHPCFGKPGPRRGVPVTPETRAKQSAAKQGEKSRFFGKPGTMLGKKHTPEALVKIGKASQRQQDLYRNDMATFLEYLERN